MSGTTLLLHQLLLNKHFALLNHSLTSRLCNVFATKASPLFATLVLPKFIPQRRPIKLLAIVLPQRHKIIHISGETFIKEIDGG